MPCSNPPSSASASRGGAAAVMIVLLTFAGATQIHAGDINRCVQRDGSVSYTNGACPKDSDAQHVASYQPEPNTPVPSGALANADARIARESEQARNLGYRQAQADEQLAAAQQTTAVSESADEHDDRVSSTWFSPYPAQIVDGRGWQRHARSGAREEHAPAQPRPPGNVPR